MDPRVKARIAVIEDLNVLEHQLPAVRHASQLRGCWIRISMDSVTLPTG